MFTYVSKVSQPSRSFSFFFSVLNVQDQMMSGVGWLLGSGARSKKPNCCFILCLSSLGRDYVACGDEQGRIWTYHVTDFQKHSSGKPILPTEVFISPKYFLSSFLKPI